MDFNRGFANYLVLLLLQLRLFEPFLYFKFVKLIFFKSALKAFYYYLAKNFAWLFDLILFEISFNFINQHLLKKIDSDQLVSCRFLAYIIL